MICSFNSGASCCWLVEDCSRRRLAFRWALGPRRNSFLDVSQVKIGRITQLVSLLLNLHAAIADLFFANSSRRVDHVIRNTAIIVESRMSLTLEHSRRHTFSAGRHQVKICGLQDFDCARAIGRLLMQ